jgi:two-component system sensor histidine kinase/response regulator
MKTGDPSNAHRADKILIVDDERDLVEMLAFVLQKKGYETARAYAGTEAWERIQSENPDLIILDLMLPDLDGWEICRMVRRDERKQIRGIPILILSARALTEDRVQGLGLGADDYMTKPFSSAELVIRVEKILEKSQAIRGLYEEMDHLRGKMEEQEVGLRKVVHDLKTPLISMGASAKLLMRKSDQEESLDFLRSIYENSLRLTRWLEEILLFSDSPFKGMVKEMEEVEVQTLVKRTVDLLRASGREKEIEIDFQSPSHLPSVLCNVRWMQRALENLLANAVKYTPERGKVEVAVVPSEDGEAVEIVVKDNGIGIHAEDLPRIFEPFQRGRNASGEKGIGLGLSLVKEVIDLHAGKISVRSEPQKGSIFGIVLPVIRKQGKKGGEKAVVNFTNN